MITAGIALIVLLFLCGVLVFAIRGRIPRFVRLEDVEAQLRPVDVDAFRTLVSDDTSEFLHARVPHRFLTNLQRERWLLASTYVRIIAQNAGVLVRAGQLASQSRDPLLAARGSELAKTALAVRLEALRLLPQLYVFVLLPRLAGRVGSFVPDQYACLATITKDICSIQTPTV